MPLPRRTTATHHHAKVKYVLFRNSLTVYLVAVNSRWMLPISCLTNFVHVWCLKLLFNRRWASPRGMAKPFPTLKGCSRSEIAFDDNILLSNGRPLHKLYWPFRNYCCVQIDISCSMLVSPHESTYFCVLDYHLFLLFLFFLPVKDSPTHKPLSLSLSLRFSTIDLMPENLH